MSSGLTPSRRPRKDAAADRGRGPFRTQGEIFSVKSAGQYHQLTIVAEDVPEVARPGHFVAVDVGGELSSSLGLRAFSVARTRPSGVYGGTVDVVVDPRGPGSRWLAARAVRDKVDLIGPLGRPFSLPKQAVTCVLVGVDYAAAPLFGLAEQLRERGCGVHIVLGASTEARLYGVLEARRAALSVTVATFDASVGIEGTVTAPAHQVLARTGADVVYAAAPSSAMRDLRAVAEVAAGAGAWCQTLVEAPMPCATGLCQACTIPVLGDNWHPRIVRGCLEGPVFPAERVRWEALAPDPGGPS